MKPSVVGVMEGEQLAQKPVPQYGQNTMREFFAWQWGQCCGACVERISCTGAEALTVDAG